MFPAAALAALLLTAGGSAISPRLPTLALGPLWDPPGVGAPASLVGAFTPGAGGRAPVCLADVCQPRVWIPGFTPQFHVPGRRTALALSLLRRTNVGPLASVAGALAAAGLRIDYTPASATTATSGVGDERFQVFLRWRLDALNRPVWGDRPGR
jgi:hypothetical protein